ncbi:hypothetical protein DOY81_002168, partial [Sarcophaga bullata]
RYQLTFFCSESHLQPESVKAKMNFNKYFLIFAIVILAVLSVHEAEAHHHHHFLGKFGHEVAKATHKVGHKIEHITHKAHKAAKKVKKVVGTVRKAKKIIKTAGVVAGAIA